VNGLAGILLAAAELPLSGWWLAVVVRKVGVELPHSKVGHKHGGVRWITHPNSVRIHTGSCQLLKMRALLAA
jgi:hypothetical protein